MLRRRAPSTRRGRRSRHQSGFAPQEIPGAPGCCSVHRGGGTLAPGGGSRGCEAGLIPAPAQRPNTKPTPQMHPRSCSFPVPLGCACLLPPAPVPKLYPSLSPFSHVHISPIPLFPCPFLSLFSRIHTLSPFSPVHTAPFPSFPTPTALFLPFSPCQLSLPLPDFPWPAPSSPFPTSSSISHSPVPTTISLPLPEPPALGVVVSPSPSPPALSPHPSCLRLP